MHPERHRGPREWTNSARPAKLEPPRDPNQSVLATSNQQVSLEWTNWTPTHEDIIQKLQYRVKLAGDSWDPDWTDLPGQRRQNGDPHAQQPHQRS